MRMIKVIYVDIVRYNECDFIPVLFSRWSVDVNPICGVCHDHRTAVRKS